MSKIAFYLSGGGVAAIECIGAMIESLDKEHGIRPNFIKSCSGGGIPAGLWSKEIDILPLCNSYKVSSIIKLNSLFEILKGKALINNNGLKELLESLIGFDYIPNFYCNITDKNLQNTYFVKANCSSILCSASIPEVFPSRTLCVDGIKEEEYEENCCKKLRYIETTLDMFNGVDGGVYNIIPTPTIEEYETYDEIFILVCSMSPVNISSLGRIQRSLETFLSTMEREYRSLVKHYSSSNKIHIIRPPNIDGSLLDWSKDFICYHSAYDYIKSATF